MSSKAQATADSPQLNDNALRDWFDRETISRARPYARGALLAQSRSGRTLKALCQGSERDPYRVSITLTSEGGIESGKCSCPVGHACKHQAALLLAYLDDPQVFAPAVSLHSILEKRTHAELVALVEKLVARRPELESLVVPPSFGSRPFSVAALKKRVAAAFRQGRDDDDWVSGDAVAAKLEPLTFQAESYADAGHWFDAVATYRAIAEGITEQYEGIEDEGELSALIDECQYGMARCLGESSDETARVAALQGIFDVFEWDLDLGGIVEGPVELLSGAATAAEKRTFANWVREIQADADESARSWLRQRIGGVILGLTGEEMDDDERLAFAREMGRTGDAMDLLLQRNRINEAIALARGAADHELIALADRLVLAGYATDAEAIVKERAGKGQFLARFVEWRMGRAEARGDHAELAALAESAYRASPSVHSYNELKRRAMAAGTWDTLRPSVFADLGKAGRHDLLIHIALGEGRIGDAITSLEKAQAGPSAWTASALKPNVANAAERDYPQEAIALYVDLARDLIRNKNRSAYQGAIQYLSRVKALYGRMGASDAWVVVIDRIRQENPTLRALHEEIRLAKL